MVSDFELAGRHKINLIVREGAKVCLGVRVRVPPCGIWLMCVCVCVCVCVF